MALSDLLSAMETGRCDTPDTPQPVPGYQGKPLPIQACTLDTPDTPQIINAANDETGSAAHFAWRVHFLDRNPVTVTFSPMLDHASVLAFYPAAVAAEPISEAGSPTEIDVPDDRRTCRQCSNLRGGACSVATPGGAVSANRGYRPVVDLQQRCEAFNERGI